MKSTKAHFSQNFLVFFLPTVQGPDKLYINYLRKEMCSFKKEKRGRKEEGEGGRWREGKKGDEGTRIKGGRQKQEMSLGDL